MADSTQIQDIRQTLNLAQLPAMPHSALSVLQLDNDVSKVDINALVRPIEADPGLASQVLKFLNSSYFGFQNTISNVRQGISLVGIRVVKNFVLWKAVFSLIPKSKNNQFDVALLWNDSLCRAMFARFLLLETRLGDPELTFAGTLLQDMAIPVLMKIRPQEYTDFFAVQQKQPNVKLSTLETQKFGWNHAAAAGILARNWKLPELLCVLMEKHIDIQSQLAQENKDPNVSAVILSALLPASFREEWPEKEGFWTCFRTFFPGKDGIVQSICGKLDKEFSQYSAILQLPAPKKTLSSVLFG